MILTLGAHSIDIGYAQDPRQEDSKLIQATTRTASGVKHTESYQVVTDTETYQILDADEDKFLLFIEFFKDYAVGQLNSFDILDDLGVQKTVTFASSDLPDPGPGQDPTTKVFIRGDFLLR